MFLLTQIVTIHGFLTYLGIFYNYNRNIRELVLIIHHSRPKEVYSLYFLPVSSLLHFCGEFSKGGGGSFILFPNGMKEK